MAVKRQRNKRVREAGVKYKVRPKKAAPMPRGALTVGVGTITVTVPTALAERVLAQPVPPEQVVAEALRDWVEKHPEVEETEKSEQQRFEELLIREGLWTGWEEQRRFIDGIAKALGVDASVKPMSTEELWKLMEGVPSLSELIIAEREEGR